MKNQRSSNIELLRLLCMLGVIFLHYYNAGMGGASKYVAAGSINDIVLRSMESFFICAVDVFVMISGYFLSQANKRTVGRALNLLIQTSIYRILYYFVDLLLHHKSFRWLSLLYMMLPMNWFVMLYVTLYLISPLLNHAFSLTKQKTAVLLVICLFSCFPTIADSMSALMKTNLSTFSTISMYGNNRGYTITNFCMCYLIGAYLRQNSFSGIRKPALVGILLLTTCTLVLWSKKDGSTAWAYYNPVIIVHAAALILLFLKFEMGCRPVINELSGAAFSVYILHPWFLHMYNTEPNVNGSVFKMLLHILFTVFSIAVMSYAADKVYKLLFGKAAQILKKYRPYTL
ncbi:MAG: acyltransferase [Eubacteriales bacterium]|nr:acyltransferase [Eubacteriales bacterium]